MKRRQLLQTGAATAGLLGLAGCTGGSATDTPEPTSAGATSEGVATVRMVTDDGRYYFDPIGLFVAADRTVAFENASGRHSTVAYRDGNGAATTTRVPEGAAAWRSSVLTEPGATFEHTFEVPGTYDYFCGPHKSLGMVGRIVVAEPGGPADGSVPPDGDVPAGGRIVDAGAVPYDEFAG